MTAVTPSSDTQRKTFNWRGQFLLALFVVIAVATVYVTNLVLTERFTASTKNRAEVRQALYIGNLISELQRTSVLPLLLSRDPVLITALNSNDYSQTAKHLIAIKDDIQVPEIFLIDAGGRVVSSSDRSQIGASKRQESYFISAIRSNETAFNTYETEAGAIAFNYTRRIEFAGDLIGVIQIEVDLRKFETSWSSISDAVFVADSSDRIILSTEPKWRGLTEEEALAAQPAPSAIERAIQATADWAALPAEALYRGGALMRLDTRVSFRGWRMVSFTSYSSVRERVNGILALEIMGFAILLAMSFYFSSRRAWARSIFFQRETAELRELNDALQHEIAQRQRAERDLEVAEQTLQQSSKLAVLGEMSASVSHELNQPLAAMKTYLAGARLLLQRRRPEEALSSFQRIDDLIERMGTITRQLKSYARKGENTVAQIDVRDCVASAMAMMEPQLKNSNVRIVRSLPQNPVLIMADRGRLEQVLINLLRNAIDATKRMPSPEIRILLAEGETVALSVRDNGPGIQDLDALFEPFYTTKAPGDGVGLGLAISSGIITDLGGRLTARNGNNGGAVFEIQLPLARDTQVAAAE